MSDTVFGVPFMAGILLIAASLYLVVDPILSMYVIRLILVVYLIAGTQNAWNLLLAGRFEVGAWSVTRTPTEDDDGR